MSSETKLAYTVHHKGRKYTAGMTAEEIGPVAGEFGKHVWEGGQAPAKSAIPGEDAPDGGTFSATPVVPPPSGLPGGPNDEVIAGILRTAPPGSPVEGGAVGGQGGPENSGVAGGDGAGGAGDSGSTPAKKAAAAAAAKKAAAAGGSGS